MTITLTKEETDLLKYIIDEFVLFEDEMTTVSAAMKLKLKIEKAAEV